MEIVASQILQVAQIQPRATKMPVQVLTMEHVSTIHVAIVSVILTVMNAEMLPIYLRFFNSTAVNKTAMQI